jgi:molecular chaperone IbpA
MRLWSTQKGLAAVLRSYIRQCLAQSLPGSLAAWMVWYFLFAAAEVVVLWSGDLVRYVRHEGPLAQGAAIAICLLLPLVAMLVFRLVFIAPFQLFRDSARSAVRNKFPQSSIVRTREDSYCILVALAGFSRDELTVTEHEQVLVVAGQRSDGEGQRAGGEYPRGTFGYPFERRFNLAANVEVRGASLENGMLRIEVFEQVEPKKPRRVDIRPVLLTSQPAKIIERPKVA